MSSPAEQPSFILIRRLADGSIEWIPIEVAQRVPVAADAAYTLIDRADYEAPQTLTSQRRGDDLVVQVQGTEALVLEGFFAAADVAFYPTTNIAGGAGPFSGSPLTADSPVPAASSPPEQVVWSAGADERGEETSAAAGTTGAASQSSGGSSPLLWVGLGAGGLGLLALAGGGGGSGGGESGGSVPPPPPPPTTDTVPPQITSGTTAPAIAENTGPGQVVYTATATDAGTITYSLKAGDDAAAFSINATTGAVTLAGNPDFEAKPSYTFTVVATDNSGNSAERAVSLAIGNVNDSGPVTITSGATATAINENSGPQQVVYTVTATGGVAAVTYSLKAGGDAAAFSINASTGVVTLTANPDQEAKSSYNFTVVATDGTGSAERAVSLAINDLDDSAPTITSGATATAINENSGAGQVVYTVTSTDTGDISTGSTTYSLKPVNDSSAFTINATTGAVTLTANPDDEAKGSYSFTVVARDAAGNSSERAVSLGINDLDEVAPTITSSATANPITENSGANQLVYTVTSTDTGDISTGNTAYSLKAGGDAAAFSINASTGAVRLTGNPDFETKPSYNFTVVATDTAQHSSEKAVSLAINNIVDETPPTVSSVEVTSAVGAQNGILNAGDVVSVTVTMSESTLVNTSSGTPTIEISIGGDRVEAGYVSGSGTSSLVFTYTIQPGDEDSNGISIPANTLDRNGGSMADASGNAANLSHGGAGNNSSFVVDANAPTLSSSTPSDGAHDVPRGEDIVLNFSEDVLIGSGNIVISSGLDVRTIAVNDSSQVSISGNGHEVTIDPILDLIFNSTYNVQIPGGALTDEAGNPQAGITFEFTTEELIVGPGGLTDPSAAMSRTFASPASEEVDIRVALVDATLSAAGTRSGAWGGSANLGSDDRVMLASSGADSQDPPPANQIAVGEPAVGWESSHDHSNAGSPGSSLANSTHFATSMAASIRVGGEGHANGISFADMPVVIVTSQGLV